MINVFIDGEAGTTGLQIRERLADRRDISLTLLGDERRRDLSARRDALNAADCAILCLPDEAAREAVALIEPASQVKVIDASTAHRVAEGWTYGFPEMSPAQRQAVVASSRIANPGCYPTGFIALVRPLVEAGLVPRDFPLTVNAVSGYSGGGKGLIAEFEGGGAPDAFRAYGYSLAHKHVPEMQRYAGLEHPPVFAPAVARFAQGMLVEVPLQLWALPAQPKGQDLRAALADAYTGCRFVSVASAAEDADLSKARAGAAGPVPALDPESLNGTNRLELHVFANEEAGQGRLVALLDNLGKGASGAAVQSLNLMFGLDEGEGLEAIPLRRATRADMAVCALIHRAASWLNSLHTPEDDRAFFSGPVFDACEVWLAGDPPAGFIAFRAGWIDQPHVAPEAQRHGLGSALLAKALEDGSERRLWTFQGNVRARAFYERHGFTAEGFTDGAANEEREPDVLYFRPGRYPSERTFT